MNVLANAHRALLAVHKLESIFSYSPIHCVERKIFANGINDFVALLFFVDELALVGRANVQFSTITNNAAFTYVVIAADHIAYFYVFQSNFRSEEHTSELQSLMRISYAVFCLTQKKK